MCICAHTIARHNSIGMQIKWHDDADCSCVHIWDEITVIEDRVDMNQYSKKIKHDLLEMFLIESGVSHYEQKSWRTDFLTTKNTELATNTKICGIEVQYSLVII